MPSDIDLQFYRCERDAALEGVVQRWIARLRAMRHDIVHARIAIDHARGGATHVGLMLLLGDGGFGAAMSVHADPICAVSNAFRDARRALIRSATYCSP